MKIACARCLDKGTILNSQDEEVYCPDCIGIDLKKQYKLRQKKAQVVIDNPKSPKVSFVFKNKQAKINFLSGLSDGWGESYCSLTWIGDFHDAKEMFVEPQEDDYE